MGDFSQMCNSSSLIGEIKPTGTGWAATPTTDEGQNVYEITQSGQPGYGYITNTATPMLVKVEDSIGIRRGYDVHRVQHAADPSPSRRPPSQSTAARSVSKKPRTAPVRPSPPRDY